VDWETQKRHRTLGINLNYPNGDEDGGRQHATSLLGKTFRHFVESVFIKVVELSCADATTHRQL